MPMISRSIAFGASFAVGAYLLARASLALASHFQKAANKADLIPEQVNKNFAMAAAESNPRRPTLSLPSAGAEPQSRALGTVKESHRYPEQPLFRIILFNTPRLPKNYVCDILQRIFHEKAERAQVASLFEPQILTARRYNEDIARSKMREVRIDAEMHEKPIPYMRCVPARKP